MAEDFNLEEDGTDVCSKCLRGFPPDLLNSACISGSYTLPICPLCYGDIHKEIHGFSWQPTGEIASDLLEQAEEWAEEQGWM